MIGPASHVRAMLGYTGQTVVLPGGRIVACALSVATANQDLGGETTVAGRSTTVRIAEADAGDLAEGQTVLFENQPRKVLEIHRVAGGRVLRITLGGAA